MNDALTVYEFGVMSSVYTLEAPDDRVADCAMLVALRTNAPVVVYQPDSRVLPSGLDRDPQAALDSHFGGSVEAFMTDNRDAIVAAIESIQEGHMADRAARRAAAGGGE